MKASSSWRSAIVQFVISEDVLIPGILRKIYTHTNVHKLLFYIFTVSNWSCGVIKYTRVPLSCDTIWSIHPVLDIRTVHIVLCIHHLLLLFNNNTNSLLLRRLLWDWLVASQERWVCTKLPMYVLSTFLLPFHITVVTTLYYRGRYELKFAFPNEGM